MISKSTKKMIVQVSEYGNVSLYSNLKLWCKFQGVNYHSYKSKKFPFEYKSESLSIKGRFYTMEIHKLEYYYNKKSK